ncbi:MAG: M55 family metallopeptidase [Limnochordia bacterium]
MKFYITTDLEGVVGVERFSQTYGDEPFRFASMRQLTQEANACIRGILDAYPDAVIDVSDGHGSGGIIKEDMDPRANYLRGQEQTRPRRQAFYQYDATMFLGQHAMAGMANAPLCHTMSSKNIVYYRMNNVYVGEFGFWAAMAGSHGVPVIFASGDDRLVAEAQALVPGISTVITKWGEGWQKARHMPVQELLEQIQSTVSSACQRIDQVSPVWFDPPYSWEVRHIYPQRAPARKAEGVRVDQIDAHTILYRSDEMLTLLNAR